MQDLKSILTASTLALVLTVGTPAFADDYKDDNGKKMEKHDQKDGDHKNHDKDEGHKDGDHKDDHAHKDGDNHKDSKDEKKD